MQANSSSRTSPTLLLRLRDLSDRAAWSEFLDRYGPKIFRWCKRYNLQPADATDVTQEVLTKLVRAMRSFEYDRSRGSFRAWLKTVTNNTIRDVQASWSQRERGSGDSQVLHSLAMIQAPEAMAALAAEIETEAERELLREAEERVRLRVKPHTWQAYRGTMIDGRTALEVAQQLGVAVTDVYIAKSRVLKMLRQEVEKLNHLDHAPQ